MAVDYLSSLNVGSGLNTSQIVDSLVAAEKAPRETKIQEVLDNATVSISELGKLKNEITVFNASALALDGNTGLALSSTDTTLVTVETTGTTLSNEFQHQMEISQLANAQVIEFSGFSSSTAFVNIDELKIDFGQWTSGTNFNNSASDLEDKTLSFTNNGSTSPSLSDVRDAINGLTDTTTGLSLGITASIIDTGNNTYSLVVKSTSGVENAMKVTSNLSGAEVTTLKYDPSTAGIADAGTETVAAANSIFTLDGVSLTRSTNNITDVIAGVQFNLLAVTTSAETVSANYNNAEGLNIIQTVVDELNYLISMINTLTATGSDGKEGGAMEGDLFLRTLKNKLGSMTTTAIAGYDKTATAGDTNKNIYLSNFGVTTELDGSLSIDEDTFKTYYAAFPEHLAAITTSGVFTDNTGITGSITGDNFIPGVYAFTLDTSVPTATLGSDTNLGSDAGATEVRYSSVTGDTTGVILTTAQSTANANVYVGRSLLNTLSNYLTVVLSSETGYGDLDTKIETYEDDFKEYTLKLEKLEEDMAAKRALYQQKFTAMDQAIAGFKETQTFLTNMMAGWASNN
ncbi:flagellar filament capping protein FliD [Alphaproteobacteria bacterium]|nr:flagellar filament capping protein FliD [Alphaproteobacteria bacterium]